MVSISHVVEDIVKHRPYLSESLAAGIINVSSLARQLQPDVERALQKGVNTGAIVMALNRLAPYLQVREQVQLNKLLSNMGDIILRSSLCDYTFKNSPTPPFFDISPSLYLTASAYLGKNDLTFCIASFS